MTTLNPLVLVPIGKIILLAGFGACLVRAMHGELDLSDSFTRLAIGFLAILFFPGMASSLDSISHDLTDFISHLGDQDNLRKLVLDAFRKASQQDNPVGGFNIPAILEQAWRTGVWGVMTLVVDWFFLMASFLLECAHEVLWQLLLFLFPLAAGAFPFFPKVLTNLALYAIELALWFPILTLVEITTGLVARSQMTRAGSWGGFVVATEILSIVLTLMIPSVTHRFLNGAFHADLGATDGAVKWAKNAAVAAAGFL